MGISLWVKVTFFDELIGQVNLIFPFAQSPRGLLTGIVPRIALCLLWFGEVLAVSKILQKPGPSQFGEFDFILTMALLGSGGML